MIENIYNIPTVTAGGIAEHLTELYITAYTAGMLDKIPSVALWGAMGVGKSTAVKAIAEKLSEKIGKEVTVTDIRLLNFSPIDLRGIPSADERKEFTVWLKPKIFDLPKDGIHILFLDEISAAPQSLQTAAYQIALDKRIGEFELPENCIVICAGNRTTDRSVAFRMPKALANRLMHFEVNADFDSWAEWALNNGIDERVIGYLSFDNSKLAMEADMEELAFPTPRSWEFISNLLKTTGKSPREIHTLLCGCLGVSTAIAFEEWCSIYSKLPPIKDIFNGSCTVKIQKPDILFALISSMLTRIAQYKNSMTAAELENACNYISRIPADFASMFFRKLTKIDEVANILIKIPSFNAWIRKNSNLL